MALCCLNDQAILLMFYTLKGVYQCVMHVTTPPHVLCSPYVYNVCMYNIYGTLLLSGQLSNPSHGLHVHSMAWMILISIL